MKVSLIQLLQEKSATNKTLALENCRLAERVSVILIQVHLILIELLLGEFSNFLNFSPIYTEVLIQIQSTSEFQSTNGCRLIESIIGHSHSRRIRPNTGFELKCNGAIDRSQSRTLS